MADRGEPRRWTARHPDGGRVDVDGVEWFRTDGTPDWYRWDGDTLITRYKPVWPADG